MTPASANNYIEAVPGATFQYNTAYKVRMSPSNSCGTGRFVSPPKSFTTEGTTPNEAPTNLVTTYNEGLFTNFTWSGISDTNAATGGFPITSYLI